MSFRRTPAFRPSRRTARAIHHVAALSLAAALGLSAAGNAMAQSSTPAAPAASPAKKALVEKVLQLQRNALEGLGAAMIGQPSQMLLQQVGHALQKVPADKREALGKEIQADVQKFFDSNAPLMRERAVALAPSTLAPLLEERFSEDELKTLVTWLESPVSQKFSQVAPEGQRALTQKLVEDTRATVGPKLKALEQSVSKKVNAAIGAASAPAKPASGPKQ